MSLALPDGLDAIDWSRPWLADWRMHGESLAARVRHTGLVVALNAAAARGANAPRFVAQAALPRGEGYEEFIARTGCVPTRDNLHDMFNGLAWLIHPRLKWRLNALQTEQLAAQPNAADGRGAVRDALTLFDENAALLRAPPLLVDSLRRRDWRAAFVEQRGLWGQARVMLFGHALIEKLLQPRKPITAHAWVVPQTPRHDGVCLSDDLAARLTAAQLAAKPFMPLPVLGVPGWWPQNRDPAFYDDASVFRGPK